MPAVFVLLTALSSAAAHAQPVAIEGGTVYTLGPQGTIADATVVIDRGRIVAVGASVRVPSDARIIDARGKIVTPGIFDPYSRLGLMEISLIEESVDDQQHEGRFSASFDVAHALNPRSTLVPVTRIEGVTRAMVAPHSVEGGSVIAGQGAVVQLGGPDDFLLAPRAALFVALGETGAALSGQSRIAATMSLREALEDAGDFADHRQAYARGERRDYVLTRPDLEALAGAIGGGQPVVVFAHRASDIRSVLALAREHALRVVIAGGAEAWMVADELADARVPVIIDPSNNLPARFEMLGARYDNAALLVAAGVTVAFAIAESHNARNLKQQAGIAVAYGLPWLEALKAITINPAAIYEHDDRYGTLEVGKDADVVVWSDDPLEVTTFADHVFIRGREMEMESRHSLLRERYRELDQDWPPAYRR